MQSNNMKQTIEGLALIGQENPYFTMMMFSIWTLNDLSIISDKEMQRIFRELADYTDLLKEMTGSFHSTNQH